MPQATISLPSELKRHAWFIESLKVSTVPDQIQGTCLTTTTQLYESVVSPTVVDKKVRQAYNTAYQEELLHYRKPEAAGIGISSTLAMLGLFIRIKREAEQGSGNDVSQFFVRLNFEPTCEYL